MTERGLRFQEIETEAEAEAGKLLNDDDTSSVRHG